MAIFDALIGAGGSILGGLIGSAGVADRNRMQMEQAQNATVASKEMAYAQQLFQEGMSNTAYQRAMKDMKAAGLNPILAYQQGGASSPAGAMGQAAQAQLENEMEALGEGVSLAGQKAKDAESASLMREQNKQVGSQTDLNKANADLAKTMEEKAKIDTVTSAAQASKLESEKALADQQTKNAMVQAGILAHNVTSAAGEARIKQAEADNAERFGPGSWGQLGSTVERVIRRLGDAARNVKPSETPPTAKQNAPLLRDDPSHWLYKKR